MFRSGGSTGEGITSGLAPRQGYDIGGLTDSDIAEIRKQSRELTQGNRKADMNQFLIDFGLNMVSGTPKGNIFATAAESAKDPMAAMNKSRSDREAMQYASEADMFKTLVGAQADIMGSDGQSKIFSKQQAAEAVSTLMGEWQELRDKEKDMDPQDFADKKAQIFGEIQQYQKENPALSSLFDNKEWKESVMRKLKTRLKKSLTMKTIPDPENTEGTIEVSSAQYYKQHPDELALDAGRLFMDYYQEMAALGYGSELDAEGGRVGRYAGGPMMQAQQAPDETVPAEMTNISEEELRRRLPPEVGDDVVKLLANSAEALEDFAMIKTAQDIARFNKKYGVDLTLPAEA